MDPTTALVERELRGLVRRVQQLRQRSDGEVELEGSAYDILLRLVDGGAARLSTLAAEFELDPSTITRQVQALERSGLVERSEDPADRRASILAASQLGAQKLRRSREWRERRLTIVLEAMPDGDRAELARLLADFNAAARATRGTAVTRSVDEAAR